MTVKMVVPTWGSREVMTPGKVGMRRSDASGPGTYSAGTAREASPASPRPAAVRGACRPVPADRRHARGALEVGGTDGRRDEEGGGDGDGDPAERETAGDEQLTDACPARRDELEDSVRAASIAPLAHDG